MQKMIWITNGILAGLIAGICMGIATELGYRLNLIKANLIHIDGSFAARLLKIKPTMIIKYVLGILFHCFMGAFFGLFYAALAFYFQFDLRMILFLAPYVILLWLIMLFFAMPVAGQGFMGRKGGRQVWLEQLAVHIVFGIALWWAIGLFKP
jgi:hypothetical protein